MLRELRQGRVLDRDVAAERCRARLRADLLVAQYALKEHAAFPAIVLIAGVDGAGKGETVNKLNEWMDPRHIRTAAFGPPIEEEREHPRLWRYWMALPPKGLTGVLFGSWYTEPVLDRAWRRSRRAELDQAIEEINRFEQMLADEGALIVKLWFHLSKEAQRKRLLQQAGAGRWRVTELGQRFLNDLQAVFLPERAEAGQSRATPAA